MRKFAKALIVPAALAVFAVGCETDNGAQDDDVMLEEDGTMEDDGMGDDGMDDTDEDF
jgi:hypothetical protein